MGRLVLSRRPGQVIHIGPDIKIQVVDVNSHGKVRLAIEAPSSLIVDRAEVAERRKLNFQTDESRTA